MTGRISPKRLGGYHRNMHKREAADSMTNREIFADKIYSDFPYWEQELNQQAVSMFTPVKAIKGEKKIIDFHEKLKIFA